MAYREPESTSLGTSGDVPRVASSSLRTSAIVRRLSKPIQFDSITCGMSRAWVTVRHFNAYRRLQRSEENLECT